MAIIIVPFLVMKVLVQIAPINHHVLVSVERKVFFCHSNNRLVFDIPCTESTPSCQQTCDKVMPCGHTCQQRCHSPPCPPCEVLVKKTCRCGRFQGECKCSEEYLCSTKCQEMKTCGKHRCGKRCCDGNHLPCTVVGIDSHWIT